MGYFNSLLKAKHASYLCITFCKPVVRRLIVLILFFVMAAISTPALPADPVVLVFHGGAGTISRERVMQALTRVGLSHRAHAKPHEMSGGEQQRACIARAIVNEPGLLLVDEPTGNLGPRVADEIQKLLIELHKEGTAVLMATHDYRIVKKFPARTLALVKGRLVEVDPETL